MSQQIESQEQALSVLVQAAQLAQKRGAYDLTEAGLNNFRNESKPFRFTCT